MQKVEVRIKRKDGCNDLPLPKYMSEGASGMDLYAAVNETTLLKPQDIKLIPTGIHIAVPKGHEAQVRPRSGLALKHGVTIVNTPGTIDSDYRGEVGIILTNIGQEAIEIKRGMRIAQLVILPVVQAELLEVQELDKTSRDTGGFASTGI
jgi:dUTP pyrophosphatase